MVLNNFVQVCVLVTLVIVSKASIYEDEERINSEGMWQNTVLSHEKSTASAENGNSRFGFSEILTTFGLKNGESTLGLVVFPFVFPIVVLLAIALFIISLFGGAAPFVSRGRRIDGQNGNELLSSTNSTSLTAEILNSEACIERIGCEILERTGHKTKIFSLLRKLSWLPDFVENVDIAVTGRRTCSAFKCRVKDFIARTWMSNYAKYFP